MLGHHEAQDAGKRLARTLTALRQEASRFMHPPLARQHESLTAVLRAHYRYYGSDSARRGQEQRKRTAPELWLTTAIRCWIPREISSQQDTALPMRGAGSEALGRLAPNTPADDLSKTLGRLEVAWAHFLLVCFD